MRRAEEDEAMPTAPSTPAAGCPFAAAAYDPLAPEQLQDPYPAYAAARGQAPVFRSEALGLWFITRYEDVAAAVRDTETFSSQFIGGGPRLADRLAASRPEALRTAVADGVPDDSRFLLTTDPPAHHVRRKLAQQAFTPRRVAALEPLIVRRAEHLCDTIAAGETELMGAFAYPLTSFVIAGILGLGDELAAGMRQVAEDLLVTQGADRHELDEAAWDEMLARLGRISAMHGALARELAARRREPADDLLTAFAGTALADGTSLADADIIAIATELILAGTDTTANLIAHCVLYTTADPALWRSLACDGEATAAVVEETLRRRGSSKGLLRVTTRDVEIGGATIPEGAVVQLLYGSANHDESVFEDPTVFRPGRPGIERHLAFGRGTHFCLGAPLARLEMRVAMATLSRRFPDLHVPAQQIRYLPALTTHTLAALEVRPR
jgi:cytochrome P450